MKLPNRIITINRSPIYFGNDALSSIDGFVAALHPESIFILVDANTRKHCLPLLLEKSTTMTKAHVLEISGGEGAKTLENATGLWNALLVSKAGRNSLLVNLGGGVVSDLGGFVAAGFKRGIHCINIPTSLMGQVDAAIGGKTAVNMGNIKNQVGFFYAAKAVFIFPGFLKTLPKAHLRSGLAEIIKSAIISDAAMWSRLSRQPVGELLDQPFDMGIWLNLISSTVKYKNKVVMHDFHERKHRKVLNFGHTIGHALEGISYSGSKQPLLHGDAVAAGMICASYLSHVKVGLALSDMEEIKTYLASGFPSVSHDVLSDPEIIELIMHDKKKNNGILQFTLISKPGHPLINKSCEREEILEALVFCMTSQAVL